MVFCSGTIAPARTASASMSRRLLSQSANVVGVAASACSPHDVVYTSLTTGDRNSVQQTRAMSSLGRPPISQSNLGSSFVPPTYSALRNKVSMPFGAQKGKPYVSPYSEFFTNLDAGRTSLGTTKETEQRTFELKEQRLECGIPESELRFRTASYGRFALAPYVSAGEHRITVKVALSAIPFENEQEKEVFYQIVGSRFNSKSGDLKLSSEKFASRIENKRYLVDVIERIVTSAKDLAKEIDAGGNTKSFST
mmetsp:Transcript_15478/g.29376  ORF Transcript_15478/g.29376 Transcript_15478/m.29376 type:complete len:252 (-) Transcript_15478:177-932(-)